MTKVLCCVICRHDLKDMTLHETSGSNMIIPLRQRMGVEGDD